MDRQDKILFLQRFILWQAWEGSLCQKAQGFSSSVRRKATFNVGNTSQQEIWVKLSLQRPKLLLVPMTWGNVMRDVNRSVSSSCTKASTSFFILFYFSSLNQFLTPNCVTGRMCHKPNTAAHRIHLTDK